LTPASIVGARAASAIPPRPHPSPCAGIYSIIPAKALYRHSRESGNPFLRSGACAGTGRNRRVRADRRFKPIASGAKGGTVSAPPCIPPHAGGKYGGTRPSWPLWIPACAGMTKGRMRTRASGGVCLKNG